MFTVGQELRNQLHDKEREQHLNSRNSTDNSLSLVRITHFSVQNYSWTTISPYNISHESNQEIIDLQFKKFLIVKQLSKSVLLKTKREQ